MVTAINSLVSMFSMEIVVHLVFQMCVFVVAVRLITKAFQSYQSPEVVDNWQDWIFNYLWPTFGKLVLVLVYTFAWLHRIIAAEDDGDTKGWLSWVLGGWWSNPITWRYVNIAVCLFIYAKHLITPPEQTLFAK